MYSAWMCSFSLLMYSSCSSTVCSALCHVSTLCCKSLLMFIYPGLIIICYFASQLSLISVFIQTMPYGFHLAISLGAVPVFLLGLIKVGTGLQRQCSHPCFHAC